MGNSINNSKLAPPKNVAVNVNSSLLSYDDLGDLLYEAGIHPQVGGLPSGGNYIVYDFQDGGEHVLYTYLSDKKSIQFLKMLLSKYPEALHINPVTQQNYNDYLLSGAGYVEHHLKEIEKHKKEMKAFVKASNKQHHINKASHQFRRALLHVPALAYHTSSNKKALLKKYGKAYMRMLEKSESPNELKEEMLKGGNIFDSAVNALADLGNKASGKILKLGLKGISKLSGVKVDALNDKIPDDISGFFPSKLLPSARIKKDYSYIPRAQRQLLEEENK